MHAFNITTKTTDVADYDFRGNQESAAFANNCERAFRFRYIGGQPGNLPKYILSAIDDAGYTPIHLGGTTYKYSVIGLKRTTADDVRSALRSAYWCPMNLKYISKMFAEAVARFPELKTEFAPKLVALSIVSATSK